MCLPESEHEEKYPLDYMNFNGRFRIIIIDVGIENESRVITWVIPLSLSSCSGHRA